MPQHQGSGSIDSQPEQSQRFLKHDSRLSSAVEASRMYGMVIDFGRLSARKSRRDRAENMR